MRLVLGIGKIKFEYKLFWLRTGFFTEGNLFDT